MNAIDKNKNNFLKLENEENDSISNLADSL